MNSCTVCEFGTRRNIMRSEDTDPGLVPNDPAEMSGP
jgi:hypothetical protein